MNKMEDLINMTKLNELLNKKEAEEKKTSKVVWIFAIVGIVAAVAAAVYGVYRFFTPDYLEDFEDDFEDDYDDDDFFEDEDDEEEPANARREKRRGIRHKNWRGCTGSPFFRFINREDHYMKKGQIVQGVIERVDFPNKGIITTEEGKQVVVKNGIQGQKVSAAINKIRKGKAEGRLLEVLEPSPDELAVAGCIHAAECGGCTYQTLPYEKQLELKAGQVKQLIDAVIAPDRKDYEFQGIKASPDQIGYRNKMEFSFGDAYKDGPLALGMHKRGSFYDIVTVGGCQIVDRDFRTILTTTLEYFQEKQISFYHKLRHTGYLRHLLVRKAVKTGEILVDLVTTTQTDFAEAGAVWTGSEEELLEGLKERLLAADYSGKMTGESWHTRNDSVADTVTNEGTVFYTDRTISTRNCWDFGSKSHHFPSSRPIHWERRCCTRRQGISLGMHCQAGQMWILPSMEKSYLTSIPGTGRSPRCSLR